ncbi:hypothetical protein BJX64DRAFT_150221 [Aspergillus heterothallicus]
MVEPQSLTTLPYELVDHIGSYLCPVEEGNPQKALSQLTRTCKRLRDRFQPMLFRSYSHYQQPVSRLVSFLRAITSRPELAAAVTKLVFWDPLETTSLSTIDKDFIDTCIADRGLTGPADDWRIEGTNRHLPIETVLVYTPNIESLSIPVNEEWNLDLLPEFSSASPKIEFLSLRDLSIYYYYISGDGWAIHYGQIAPLLEASPNLEHLSLPTVEGFWEHYDATVPPMKSLLSLDLGESSPGMFFIKSIIKATESLRKFKLHWIRSTGYDESHEDWTVAEIWDALTHVKETLEEIIFDPSIEIPLGSPTANSLSSLADFLKLRVLKVNGRSLEGLFHAWTFQTGRSDMDEFVRQFFPSGLRTLVIWLPSPGLIPALFALAKAKFNGLFPDLTLVEIGASPVFKEWLPRPEWSRNEAELEDKFATAQVQLNMDIPYVPPELLNLAMQLGFA